MRLGHQTLHGFVQLQETSLRRGAGYIGLMYIDKTSKPSSMMGHATEKKRRASLESLHQRRVWFLIQAMLVEIAFILEKP